MARRRIGTAAILLYAALVVLAAWRHEVRPAFLDAPAAVARGALAWLGIPAGVAVFTSDAGMSPDQKITSQCFEVRAVEAGGDVRRLYPDPGRRCPAPAPRLRVRGEDIALYRLATALRASVAARRKGALEWGGARTPLLLVESIAAHFRQRARAAGAAPLRYALLWTESRVDYETGRESSRVVALIRWQADPESGAFVAWRPDEAGVAREWPPLGAP